MHTNADHQSPSPLPARRWLCTLISAEQKGLSDLNKHNLSQLNWYPSTIILLSPAS